MVLAARIDGGLVERVDVPALAHAEGIVPAAGRIAMAHQPEHLLVARAHPERVAHVEVDLHADRSERRPVEPPGASEVAHRGRDVVEVDHPAPRRRRGHGERRRRPRATRRGTQRAPGHLFETHVSPTMELVLTTSPTPVHRRLDDAFHAWLLEP
jgi:hypothetical protein